LTSIKIASKQNKKSQEDSDDDNIVARVKLLEAANTPPKSISKSDSLEKAMTIMMQNDFSQLPVMNSSAAKEPDGMIS
jgi:predicted transcriptional regulator